MYQFHSTEKSLTLACLLFKNMKLDKVSSTANILCLFVILYIKWATSKVQQQFNLTTFSSTAWSLTQLYDAYPKLWTCTFIGFVIDSDKKNSIFIGNKENTILQTIHQNITPQNITFQFDLLMYSIPPKNKQKLYLNCQNYQRHCRGVFKHIYHKPLNNRCITNIQFHQWLLLQCGTNNVILHNNFSTFSKYTIQTHHL